MWLFSVFWEFSSMGYANSYWYCFGFFFFFFGFRWNFIEFHVVVLSDLGHFIVMGIKVLLLLFYYLFLQMEFD